MSAQDKAKGQPADKADDFPSEESPSTVHVTVEVSETEDQEIMDAVDKIGQMAVQDGLPKPADDQAPSSLVSYEKPDNYISNAMFIAAGGSSDSLRPEPDVQHSSTSLNELIRRTNILASLREVYGKATDRFTKADTDILQDAATMLVKGEWITDDARLRNLLYLALQCLDPAHFKQDDKKMLDDKKIKSMESTETKTLCRALTSALTRNFEKNERVVPIAKKLQETNPYIRSDSKSSSGASPLPGKFSSLVATQKKRHKGA